MHNLGQVNRPRPLFMLLIVCLTMTFTNPKAFAGDDFTVYGAGIEGTDIRFVITYKGCKQDHLFLFGLKNCVGVQDITCTADLIHDAKKDNCDRVTTIQKKFSLEGNGFQGTFDRINKIHVRTLGKRPKTITVIRIQDKAPLPKPKTSLKDSKTAPDSTK